MTLQKIEEDVKQRLKSKWSRIEALAGAKPRVEALAKDIIQHFETRQQAMKGKGMINDESSNCC